MTTSLLELLIAAKNNDRSFHIWQCKLLNTDRNENENYDKIFNGNLSQKISIFEKFEEKLEKYTKMKNETEKN